MFVRCECCVLSEVSATGWSLIEKSPTECDVSEFDRETPKEEVMTRNKIKAPQEKNLEHYFLYGKLEDRTFYTEW
jgi:hypothetical protein